MAEFESAMNQFGNPGRRTSPKKTSSVNVNSRRGGTRMRAAPRSHRFLLSSLAATAVLFSAAVLVAESIPARPGGTRPAKLAKPRVLPVPESQWTEEQKQLVAKFV